MPQRNEALSLVDRREAHLSALLLKHSLVTVPTPDEAKKLLDDHKMSKRARGGVPSQIELDAERIWPLCQPHPELKQALTLQHSPIREGQLSALRSALRRLCMAAQDGEPVLEVGSTTLDAELDGLLTDEVELVGSVLVSDCIA